MDNGEKWDLGRRTQKIPTREFGAPGDEIKQPGVPSASLRRMGMWLLLASLSMLFGAILVGFLVLRGRAEQWPPPGSPPLPPGLWVSTALLVILSAVLVLAERGARSGHGAIRDRMLAVAVLLAVAFLAAQTANWMRMTEYSVLPDQSLFVWFFYVLTILHAGHVLCGLVPLALVAVRSRAGRYAEGDSEAVHLVGMYWHFLLATWIAIFAVLSS